jgi:hypothetical protein
MTLPQAGQVPPNVTRQRWTRLAVGLGVVSAVLLAGLGYAGAKTLAHSKAGRRAVTTAPATPLPETPVALLGTKSESGSLIALTALTLAAPGADGVVRGGSIIPLPVGSGIQVGSTTGLNRLAELYLSGGLQSLADSAGALLAVNFSLVAETDRAALAQLLAPAGQVSVMKDGSMQTLDATGGATLVTLQTTRLEGPHFTDVAAYWTALAKRVGKGLKIPGFSPPTATTLAADGSAAGGPTTAATLPASSAKGAMARFFNTLLSGPITVYPLRGAAVPSGASNPNNLDVYKLDPFEVTRVFSIAAPNAVSPVNANFTVTIVNPFGDPALTRAAIARMAAFGGAVALVRESKFAAPARTEFSLPGRLAKEDLKPFAATFGDNVVVPVGQPGTPHEHFAGADLTIVLGATFKALIASGGAAAAAPTTTLPTVAGS